MSGASARADESTSTGAHVGYLVGRPRDHPHTYTSKPPLAQSMGLSGQSLAKRFQSPPSEVGEGVLRREVQPVPDATTLSRASEQLVSPNDADPVRKDTSTALGGREL